MQTKIEPNATKAEVHTGHCEDGVCIIYDEASHCTLQS